MKIQATIKPIVFYDGACPLCSREINHYKNCSGANKLTWIDISQSKSVLKKYDLDFQQAMQRFHVLSPEGQFHVGAYGFVYLWSFLRPDRLASFLLTRLQLVKPMDWIYLKFADWRFKNQCGTSCNL